MEHDREESRVSAAVPTRRCSWLPRTENGTTASENAASLSFKGTTATVFASMGSMIQIMLSEGMSIDDNDCEGMGNGTEVDECKEGIGDECKGGNQMQGHRHWQC